MIKPLSPGKKFPLSLVGVLWVAVGAVASAQSTVLHETLTGVPDQELIDALPFGLGDELWLPGIPDGDLRVTGEKFERTTQSVAIQDNVTLMNDSFAPFNSDAWILRAVVRGTSVVSNSQGNHLRLLMQGAAGTYGIQMLLNRTDGNHDLFFGSPPNFSDLFSADVFTLDQLPGREMRLTFTVNGPVVQTFVDDLAVSANPTNLHLTAAMPGTLGITDWTKATLQLGSRFTGTVDDIELFHVVPYLETFTTPNLDPIPATMIFDNEWTVRDTNAPVEWKAEGNALVFKATGGATEDPHVSTEGPLTQFGSDGWVLDSTIRFISPSNLASNRVKIEVETAGGQVLGVLVRRTLRNGSRLLAYLGDEMNIIAGSASGSDLNPDTPHRVSLRYDAGGLVIRVANRVLEVSPAVIGIGAENWRRVHVRGAAAHGFSIDTVLFFEAGGVIPPTPTPAPSSTPAPSPIPSATPTATTTSPPTQTPVPTATATATTAPCCPGDANNSGGSVNANDFLSVQANFGADNGVGGQGDANCSGGAVNANDFLSVQANFGANCD